MSEEKIIEVEKKECNCFCKSEGFKKFIVVTLGTFAGVYMALSLFFAIHKPPMPMHPPMHQMQMHKHFKHHYDFEKPDKKFHKEFKGDIKAPNVEDDASVD